MSPMKVDGIRGTLPQVFGRKAALADHFFEAIFSRAPEMTAFFPKHHGRRKEVFVTLLTKTALCAETPAAMEGIAQQLSGWHRRLGIRPEHYEISCRALIEAFETILSDILSRVELDRWAEAIARLTGRLAALAL